LGVVAAIGQRVISGFSVVLGALSGAVAVLAGAVGEPPRVSGRFWSAEVVNAGRWIAS
jgi:hypothetical protein